MGCCNPVKVSLWAYFHSVFLKFQNKQLKRHPDFQDAGMIYLKFQCS